MVTLTERDHGVNTPIDDQIWASITQAAQDSGHPQ